MKKRFIRLTAMMLTLVFAGTALLSVSAFAAESTAWDGTAVSASLAGEGTEASPYLVSSAADLAYIAKQADNDNKNEFAGKYFKQTADIDLGGKVWKPIGGTQVFFRGIYDGNGHTVSGLNCDTIKNNLKKDDPKYDSEYNKYAGLFGRVAGPDDDSYVASIKNLTVSGSLVRSNAFSAPIAAYAKNGVQIINCRSSVEHIDGTPAGGIVGRIDYDEYNGKAKNYIIGCVSDSVIFTDGNVSEDGNTGRSYTYVGGIVGVATNTAISFCTNNCKIEIIPLEKAAYRTWAGGILGVGGTNAAPHNTDVLFCTNNGEIKTYTSYDATAWFGKDKVVAQYTNDMYLGGIVGKLTNNVDNNAIAGCINTVSPAIYSTNLDGAIIVPLKPNQAAAGLVGLCIKNPYASACNYSVGELYVGRDDTRGNIPTTTVKLEANGAAGAQGLKLERAATADSFLKLAVSQAVSKSYYTARELTALEAKLAASLGKDSVNMADYITEKLAPTVTEDNKSAIGGLWKEGTNAPELKSIDNAIAVTLLMDSIRRAVDAELVAINAAGSGSSGNSTENTEAPETEAKTEAPKTTETAGGEEKSGCGSFAGATSVILCGALALAGATLAKRKQD